MYVRLNVNLDIWWKKLVLRKLNIRICEINSLYDCM